MTVLADAHSAKQIADALVAQLKVWLPHMNPDQRHSLFDQIREGYCDDCGSAHLPCYCSRDE